MKGSPRRWPISGGALRRSQAKEDALGEILTDFRERCRVILLSPNNAGQRPQLYRDAIDKARDRIYTVMGKGWKPEPAK